jgi:hypothetical protein
VKLFSITGYHRDSNLLRGIPENRSSPRVVTRQWLLKNLKLTTRLKNKNRNKTQKKNK